MVMRPPIPFPALVVGRCRRIAGGGGDGRHHRRRHSHIAYPGIWRTKAHGDGLRAVVFGVSYFSPYGLQKLHELQEGVGPRGFVQFLHFLQPHRAFD